MILYVFSLYLLLLMLHLPVLYLIFILLFIYVSSSWSSSIITELIIRIDLYHKVVKLLGIVSVGFKGYLERSHLSQNNFKPLSDKSGVKTPFREVANHSPVGLKVDKFHFPVFLVFYVTVIRESQNGEWQRVKWQAVLITTAVLLLKEHKYQS